MSIVKPHLYVSSKGFEVTRHSYSGSDSFNFCARKYYLERVQGWTDKIDRSSKYFGIALEKAVTFWHQRGQDTAASVAEFVRLWAEHKDKPYTYSKIDKDWDTLNLDGQELVRLYAIRYPTFPYIVNNPRDFQVETNFEVFPGVERFAGLEFTSYIDLLAVDKATGEPEIIDMKTSGKDVPDLTVLDPQLRSYAWVKWKPETTRMFVAFLWFRKMGRDITRGDSATVLESYAGLEPGTDTTVLATDDFGVFVTTDEKVYETMKTQFIGEAKAVKLARQAFVEGNANHVPTRVLTKQRVQFKSAIITPESAEDIGRSIKRDVVNIVNANDKEFWPMQSGVRFPNEKCPNCPMRGICANRPELRDLLVTRKQQDEVDFGLDSE